MSNPIDPPPAQSRRRDERSVITLAAWVVGLCAPLLLGYSLKDDYNALMSDSAIYLMLADYLSPFSTSPEWLETLFGRYAFPPVYPLVLGWLGGGSAQPLTSHLIGALITLTMIGAYVGWLARLKLDTPTVIALGCVLGLLPFTVLSAPEPLSEPLYMLLVFAAFTALERDSSVSGSWYVAAVLIGLAAITRTIGVAAIGAFLIYWWLQTRGRRYRAAPFIALLPTCTWAFIKWRYELDSSYFMSLITASLGESLMILVRDIPGNVTALISKGIWTIDIFQTSVGQLIIAALAVAAAVGGWRRIRTGRIDAIYVALYLLIIIPWPHRAHGDRFVYCLLPLLMLYASQCFVAISTHLGRIRSGVIAPLLVAVVALPSSATIAGQLIEYHDTRYRNYVRSGPWYLEPVGEAKRTADILIEFFAGLTHLSRQVSEDECITSTYPYYVMLLSGRNSFFPPLPGATPADFDILMSQCDYIMFLNTTNEEYGFPWQYYPYERVRDSIEVIDDVYYRHVTPEPIVAAILARYTDQDSNEAPSH